MMISQEVKFSHEGTKAQREAIDHDGIPSPWLRGFVGVRTFYDFVKYDK